ncbi:amidohydrolase family protein [Pseudomonas sp. SDO528_S397]
MNSRQPAVIDTHAHVFHRDLPFIESRRFTPTYDARYEAFIAQLDAHGIDRAVLIAVSIVGTDNRYLVESLRRAQGRLRGVVAINPATDLERLPGYADAGVVGVRVNLTGHLPVPAFDEADWRRVLKFCRAHDWHIEVNDHCARLAESVEPLLDAGVRVVIDHFGMPDKTTGIDDPAFARLLGFAASDRVWVKLSGAYRIGLELAARAAPLLLNAYGARRLLWASDWPFTQYETTQHYADQVAHLARWLPEPADRQHVLWDTPAHVFQFDR